MREIEIVFNRLYEPLCFFAFKYVNDFDLAQDLVQNVFVKMLENNKVTVKNDNQIDGFFYTTVKNTCLNHIKSKYAKDVKAYPIETLEALQKESFFTKQVLTIDTTAIIQNAIKTLPNRCGEVIKLSIQELSNKEIAEEMEVSVETVKKQKKIGYDKLRKLITHLKKVESF